MRGNQSSFIEKKLQCKAPHASIRSNWKLIASVFVCDYKLQRTQSGFWCNGEHILAWGEREALVIMLKLTYLYIFLPHKIGWAQTLLNHSCKHCFEMFLSIDAKCYHTVNSINYCVKIYFSVLISLKFHSTSSFNAQKAKKNFHFLLK